MTNLTTEASVNPQPIMKALNAFATVLDRFIWVVGFMTIFTYAQDHWPQGYGIVLALSLLGFGAWYSWKFFIEPFRAGLRGVGSDRHDA
jgi:hypothetical protein